MQRRGVRRPSVRPSVCKLFAQIASSTRQMGGSPPNSHTIVQVSLHPGCAQGQGRGERSRDPSTFWNFTKNR